MIFEKIQLFFPGLCYLEDFVDTGRTAHNFLRRRKLISWFLKKKYHFLKSECKDIFVVYRREKGKKDWIWHFRYPLWKQNYPLTHPKVLLTKSPVCYNSIRIICRRRWHRLPNVSGSHFEFMHPQFVKAKVYACFSLEFQKTSVKKNQKNRQLILVPCSERSILS